MISKQPGVVSGSVIRTLAIFKRKEIGHLRTQSERQYIITSLDWRVLELEQCRNPSYKHLISEMHGGHANERDSGISLIILWADSSQRNDCIFILSELNSAVVIKCC